MKNPILSLISFIFFLIPIIGKAAETDPEGYPVFWLRGSEQAPDWGYASQFRFTRQGNTYSLTLEKLTGEFKVSNSDWTINFGAVSHQDSFVSPPVCKDGVQDGLNFSASFSERVEIKFSYTPGQKTVIGFNMDPGNGPDPGVQGLSGTLPVLYINVYGENGAFDNEVIDRNLDHKNYFKGVYWLDLNGCEWMAAEGAASVGSKEEPLPLEIKARGNYTRKGFSKKPFKLKLGAKQSLLGLSKSKHFAILAHADDNKGYLRNFTGFSLGKKIGLPWTPAMQPVEVVINNDYRGLYFLTESIRVEKDRVNISELGDKETDPSLVSGGYLVELDNYDEENQIRMEEKGQAPGYKDMLRVTFDTPEEYSDIQKRFITDQFTAMNNLVGENSDKLWSYMDMDDLARYYLVEELISHTESFHGSTYMFRDRGGDQKWHFSPLWDCGNGFNGPTNDFFYNHAPFGCTWIASIRLNGKFNDKVTATYRWFVTSQLTNSLFAEIDTFCSHITAAARADHKRWGNAPLPDSDQATPVVDNSDMDRRRNEVKNHIAAKIDWLNGIFGSTADMEWPEPQRDTTPPAPLPEYLTATRLETVAAPETPIRILNLQGIPVENPEPGNVYIVTDDSGGRKVTLR